MGGLAIGLSVAAVLRIVTGDKDLSSTIGTGTWLLSASLIVIYGSLLFTDPDKIANRPTPKSIILKWQATRSENKLQTAELRIGFVFALISGMTAKRAHGSEIVIVIVTICFAAIGGFIGFDVKRRVRRIREQSPSRDNCDRD